MPVKEAAIDRLHQSRVNHVKHLKYLKSLLKQAPISPSNPTVSMKPMSGRKGRKGRQKVKLDDPMIETREFNKYSRILENDHVDTILLLSVIEEKMAVAYKEEQLRMRRIEEMDRLTSQKESSNFAVQGWECKTCQKVNNYSVDKCVSCSSERYTRQAWGMSMGGWWGGSTSPRSKPYPYHNHYHSMNPYDSNRNSTYRHGTPPRQRVNVYSNVRTVPYTTVTHDHVVRPVQSESMDYRQPIGSRIVKGPGYSSHSMQTRSQREQPQSGVFARTGIDRDTEHRQVVHRGPGSDVFRDAITRGIRITGTGFFLSHLTNAAWTIFENLCIFHAGTGKLRNMVGNYEHAGFLFGKPLWEKKIGRDSDEPELFSYQLVYNSKYKTWVIARTYLSRERGIALRLRYESPDIWPEENRGLWVYPGGGSSEETRYVRVLVRPPEKSCVDFFW